MPDQDPRLDRAAQELNLQPSVVTTVLHGVAHKNNVQPETVLTMLLDLLSLWRAMSPTDRLAFESAQGQAFLRALGERDDCSLRQGIGVCIDLIESWKLANRLR
jgi:hypothetical protein